MSTQQDDSAAVEGKYHSYTTNAIPILVRAVWIVFWCFAIYYSFRYLLPEIQHQFAPPQ